MFTGKILTATESKHTRPGCFRYLYVIIVSLKKIHHIVVVDDDDDDDDDDDNSLFLFQLSQRCK